MEKLIKKLTAILCVLALVSATAPLSFASEVLDTDPESVQMKQAALIEDGADYEDSSDGEALSEDEIISIDSQEIESPEAEENVAADDSDPAATEVQADETQADVIQTEETEQDEAAKAADEAVQAEEEAPAFKAAADEAKELTINLKQTSAVYTGSEIKPEIVSVTDGTNTYNSDQYTVSYSGDGFVNAGVITVKVTLNDDSGATGTAAFTITPANISSCTASLADSSLVYNGQAQTPAVTVQFGTTSLVNNTDYTLAYSNNINAGQATVKVTGKGNFQGEASQAFTITKAAQTLKPVLKPATLKYKKTSAITVDGAQGALTFKSSKPAVASVSAKGVLKGKKTGTTVITINSAETANYQAATVQLKVTVKGTALTSKNTKVKLSKTSYTYDGKKKSPTVKVTYKGKTLKKNRDYKLTYKDNNKAGKATVVITGINKYSGTIKKAYKIVKAKNTLKSSISKTSINVKETSKITVKKANGQVTFASSNNKIATVSKTGVITGKKEGKCNITVTAAGDDNHKKAVKKYTVNVGPKSLTDKKCKVTLPKKSVVYDGTAKKPAVTVTFDKVKLKEGTDYTISYSDNVNAGKAKIVLKGKGKYTGTRTVNFTIEKADQKDFTISLTDNHIPLGGKAKVVTANARGKLSYDSGEYNYAKPLGDGYFQGLKATKNYVTIYVTASGDKNYKSTTRSLRVHIN